MGIKAAVALGNISLRWAVNIILLIYESIYLLIQALILSGDRKLVNLEPCSHFPGGMQISRGLHTTFVLPGAGGWVAPSPWVPLTVLYFHHQQS